MSEEKQYKVVWEISELDAKNPLQAAKTAQNWIKQEAQQYYVQDQETNEIFSVDLQEEDEDAVLPVTGEYIPEIVPRLNKKKTYYLFGWDAVCCYSKDGIDALLEEIEEYGTRFKLFCFIEGETQSVDLLYEFKNWEDYSCITEEEYQTLTNL